MTSAPPAATERAFETARGVVYPWQMDHVGHMNVQFYTARFDEATWHFFARFGITSRYMREARRGMAAVEQHTRYLRELHAGDLIRVTSELLEAKPKSVRFVHRMYNAVTGEEAASTELTGVHMDTDARRVVPFPDGIAARLAAALGQGAPGPRAGA
ncbi:MAG: acyl-CoA thioesterase [Burkholderiales bacterium]|nr:acyl-CoA thioesterase [Burkholderiales bacterium]